MSDPVASKGAGAGYKGRTLVLDTHVWIWVVEGSRDRLSPEAVTRVQEASGAEEVLVSAISVWEVSVLATAGRRIVAHGKRGHLAVMDVRS